MLNSVVKQDKIHAFVFFVVAGQKQLKNSLHIAISAEIFIYTRLGPSVNDCKRVPKVTKENWPFERCVSLSSK